MSVVKDAHSEFAALREGGHDALGLFPPVRSMEEGYRRDSKEVVRGFTLKAKTTRPAHVNLAFYLLLPHQRPPSRSNYFIRQIAAGRFSSPDFPHPGMLTRSSTVRLLPHSGERTERALDASDPKPTDDLVDGKFVFQEGIHWHYVRERGRIRILAKGSSILHRLIWNKTLRYRLASTVKERSFGILDRLNVTFDFGARSEKRKLIKSAILKKVRKTSTYVNARAQDFAWNLYALPWCFSGEGLTWMQKLVDLPFHGSANVLRGHPPLTWDDLSEGTRKMWASEAAIRNVLRDALRGVELDGFENDCAAAAWNNIAEEQTFRLIRHQCGAIWNIVKGDLAELKVCPAARTERIKELTRIKGGRIAPVTREFFVEMEKKIKELLIEHGQPIDSLPPLKTS